MSASQKLENLTIPFTIKFTNTLEELVSWHEYSLKHNIDNLKYRLFALSAIPFFVSFAYSFFSDKEGDISNKITLYFFILVIAILPTYLLFKLASKYKAKRVNKLSRALKEKQTITFSEDEIITEIESASSTLKYNFFLDLSEDENNLYLRISNDTASVWPKKYFSEEQIEFIKSKITLRESLNKNL